MKTLTVQQWLNENSPSEVVFNALVSSLSNGLGNTFPDDYHLLNLPKSEMLCFSENEFVISLKPNGLEQSIRGQNSGSFYESSEVSIDTSSLVISAYMFCEAANRLHGIDNIASKKFSDAYYFIRNFALSDHSEDYEACDLRQHFFPNTDVSQYIRLVD